ncbi:Ubiquitin conjugation factor E4 A [Fasciolopsis buskii]|uniref:Ubiquitin conjugation factor E4 A n=1 Tax=Fasciolopsis buskii TaxID=27845 RepID=A0A8E0RPJ2_9TREM|nr:Ubiquitin conjugation factor E4 A [Fasciolopsis buski]
MLVQKAISVHQYSLSCPYTSCNLTTDLSHETRLAANLPGLGSVRSPLPPDVPLLTELFFLAHASIRIGWTPLISRHFETAQQLHQLEAQWQAHEAAGAAISADSQTQFLRRLIRERTSRYLEQSTSLSNVTRLRDLLAFAVTTSQLLVQLARAAFGLVPAESTEHGTLVDLPEYLVDNVVELVSYLRRAKDDFLESGWSSNTMQNLIGLIQQIRSERAFIGDNRTPKSLYGRHVRLLERRVIMEKRTY